MIGIHPREIERGDVFVNPLPPHDTAWTAVEGAVTRADETIRCEVRFVDGGYGERVWSALDPSLKIVVKRRA